MTPSDLEARSIAGDAAAFGELVRPWDRDLRGIVWTVVRSALATDDIMQSSYEKAFRNIGRFDGTASLKTWLQTICLRGAIDHTRHESRRNENVDDLANPPVRPDTPNPAPDAIELDGIFDLLERVDQLLLMLTVGLGYSFDETAEIVGLPRGTVASKVGRARAQLRTGKQS